MTECTFTTPEEVYRTRDNSVTIIPYSDYSALVNYDMTNVTQVIVSADLVTSTTTGDDYTADSVTNPTEVWFNQDADSIWQIHMRIGQFAGIVAGSYKIRVIIIEPTYPNGLVIADDLLVDVVEIP
jgi:hypothetical protein